MTPVPLRSANCGFHKRNTLCKLVANDGGSIIDTVWKFKKWLRINWRLCSYAELAISLILWIFNTESRYISEKRMSEEHIVVFWSDWSRMNNILDPSTIPSVTNKRCRSSSFLVSWLLLIRSSRRHEKTSNTDVEITPKTWKWHHYWLWNQTGTMCTHKKKSVTAAWFFYSKSHH